MTQDAKNHRKSGIPHKFHKCDIKVTPELIEQLAKRYVDQRSGIQNVSATDLDEDPRFKNHGFTSEDLKKIIKQYSVPKRSPKEDGAYRDIYRSDLGELLMTYFFEENNAQYGHDVFVIPIKNIADRELCDKPGRGLDAIGYKDNGDGRIALMLGEAKVSEEKDSPPQVVHKSEDSIYKNQLKNIEDKQHLLSKLANIVKKMKHSDAVKFYLVMCAVENEQQDKYDVVLGCCLIRDNACSGAKDFGKMESDQAKFEPSEVHFVIPCFDKPIADTVEHFYQAVKKITS